MSRSFFSPKGDDSVATSDPLAKTAVQLAEKMEREHNYTALDGFNEAVAQAAVSKKDPSFVTTAAQKAASAETSSVVDDFSPPGTPIPRR